MVDTELTEEEQKKMEDIQALFDTRTEDRAEVKEEDHRALIEKMKSKAMPVKQKIYEESSREFQKLKEEARRRREEEEALEKEKASLNADGPVLGRCFKAAADAEHDSSSSDSDFEFEAAAPVVASKPALAKPSETANFFSKQSLETKSKSFGAFDKRNKIKGLLRSKTRAKGNAWLANELEYGSVDDHINDCKIAEVRRREMVRRSELKEEQERKRREAMMRDGMELEEVKGDEDGDDEEDDSDEGSKVEEQQGTSELIAADKETAAQMKEAQVRTEEGVNELREENGEELSYKEELESQEEEVIEDDWTQAEPCVENEEPNHLQSTNLEIEKVERVEDRGVNIDETADENTEGESAATTAVVATADETSAVPKATVGASGDAQDDTIARDSNAADDPSDEEEEFDEEAPATQPENKKDRAAAYKAMLLADEARMKKKKRLGINSLLDEEAEEEEEEDAVAGLEDFGFGTKKDNENEENIGGLDTITKDDLEHIVDTYSDDEGDEEAANRERAQLAAKEEKARHKEIMRRMKEGYDGRKHGGAGAARGGLDWNSLVAADGRKDAKRLGLLNSDEEDSEAEKDDDDDDDDGEDELALLDRVLKERHNPRNQALYMSESSESESEEESDDGEDSDEEREQAKEEER